MHARTHAPDVKPQLPRGPPELLLHQQGRAADGAHVVPQVAAVEAGAGG